MPELVAPADWDAIIISLPNAHILQTSAWARNKQRVGWSPLYYAWRGLDGKVIAAAMILRRSIDLPAGVKLRVMYCPKGPLMDWQDLPLAAQVLGFLEQLCRQEKAIFIKIDPDIPLGWGMPGAPSTQESPDGHTFADGLQRRGWVFSQDQIQFRNTVLLELTAAEDEILARMKQKTRYNIRLAQKKGVQVRTGSLADLELLYHMYAITAVRDGFVIRSKDYYLALWQEFFQAGMAQFLIAEFEGQPIAAVVVFIFAGTARYMYGMSLEEHRDLMPNYLLQWEAIRLSKNMGCQVYDLWGAPNEFNESDPIWGVYRFKEGFNGTTVRNLGAWDYAPRPLLYRLYTRTLPRVLSVMRRRGKADNRKQAFND